MDVNIINTRNSVSLIPGTQNPNQPHQLVQFYYDPIDNCRYRVHFRLGRQF